jgi:enamine deaminase RidA (YjgF/YER057c/UK114 family)
LIRRIGGWDRETRKVEPDSLKQIEAAFDNVQHTLQAAGGEGWKNVYAVRLFHTPVGEKEMGFFVEKLKQYCPDHRPILTGIGVASLAFDMMVEIEVEAHVPQSL